ncbi:MAG: hypothetical protein WC740_07880 [Verrucomicrobiia bacterium]
MFNFYMLFISAAYVIADAVILVAALYGIRGRYKVGLLLLGLGSLLGFFTDGTGLVAELRVQHVVSVMPGGETFAAFSTVSRWIRPAEIVLNVAAIISLAVVNLRPLPQEHTPAKVM